VPAGHHRGEGSDVAGEPVQLRDAAAKLSQLRGLFVW
jgi:hypothetical protein